MSANREKAERYVADPKFDDTRPRWAEVREAHVAGQESRQEEIDALTMDRNEWRAQSEMRDAALEAAAIREQGLSDFLTGALRGADSVREERDALKAEIAALREEIASHAAWAKGFAADPANGAIMAAQAEIAALREAVRMQYVIHNDKIESCVDGVGGGLLSHNAILSVRRALEEKA